LAHVYCGQTAEWMKTPLGTEVDLFPGHIVLDGVPALRERSTAARPRLVRPCLLWPRSPISATAELLFYVCNVAFVFTTFCFKNVRRENGIHSIIKKAN